VCAPADSHTEPKSKRWLQDLFIDDYFDDLTVIEGVKEHGLAWKQTENLRSMWPNSQPHRKFLRSFRKTITNAVRITPVPAVR
jgi:hypothetical protein